MLCPDRDFVSGSPHHLPVLPLLLVSDQSSLDEDVVEEDVQNDVMPGDDFTTNISAVADDVLGIEHHSSYAAPALRL